MQAIKSDAGLTLRASLAEYAVSGIRPAARLVVFDGRRETLTIRHGIFRRRERMIPFPRIRKIHHKIHAPIIKTILDGGGEGYYRSASEASEIVLELRDNTAETVCTEMYGQGGDGHPVRERIERIQETADDIASITRKPQVIHCDEVECTFDIGESKVILSGELLPVVLKGKVFPFRDIERIEAVETPKGYFAFLIFPRWGNRVVTTEGYDSRNYLSRTARMIAERANLGFLKTESRRSLADPPPVRSAPIHPRRTWTFRR